MIRLLLLIFYMVLILLALALSKKGIALAALLSSSAENQLEIKGLFLLSKNVYIFLSSLGILLSFLQEKWVDVMIIVCILLCSAIFGLRLAKKITL